MKTIIAGGRDYQFRPQDTAFLDHLKSTISEVVCGGAKGADAEGKKWAENNGVPVALFKADWGKYGRGAGPRRNQEMAEYADTLILFQGGRGSASMHKLATKAGLKIYDLREPEATEDALADLGILYTPPAEYPQNDR